MVEVFLGGNVGCGIEVDDGVILRVILEAVKNV